MRNFYLIVNREKPRVEEAAGLICSFFAEQGCRCIRLDRHDGLRRDAEVAAAYRYTDRRTVPEDTDCVICLGGDGTLIQAARDLAGRKIPLFGINMGHLGYLTQVSREESMEPVLDALLNDSFTLEKRMMLEGSVVGAQKTVKGIALNEIVLTRQDVLQMLHFQVYLNDEFFNEYMADGIIAATPTGSTAYNLSAGGPIVAPGAQLMVLTPICSHSLNARSIVLSPEDSISIRLVKWSGGKSYSAVFDGDQVFPLHYGERLEICRAPKYTTLIQLKNVSFLENIRQKMDRI